VTATGADGTIIEALDDPRATFAGYTPDAKWSYPQIAYFRSYATWHYLVEPCLFTWPGVEAHEVEPWTENGQTWRGLSVRFPDTIDTHNPTQLYYFDDTGLLRRMDYQPVVNGRAPTAHYIRSEETFDGSWCRPSGTSTPATKTAPRTCRGSRSRSTSATSGSAERLGTTRSPEAGHDHYLINHLRIPGGIPKEENLAYLQQVEATTAPYGGKWLALDAEVQVLEGAWPGSVVLLGSPTWRRRRRGTTRPSTRRSCPCAPTTRSVT
jgi:uncharacterized protein (DUF1330 family)